MKVKKEWLSPKQQELIQRSGQRYVPTEKLIPNLFDKDEYVIHYRNLQYYISQGMVLEHIYEAIKFDQSPWMKPYIEMNTALRAKAKNDFEKDFFKLMNNAVFGKTMENVRERIEFDLVVTSDTKRLNKLSNRPKYKRNKIFNENVVGVESYKTKILLNKPILVGATILDLSKVL